MKNNTQTENKTGKQETFNITPETKVGELLDNYPELETVLIDFAPAFKKLKNPLLRKTIARVTNLRQAARVGNVSLGEMINRLRKEAGLEAEAGIIEDEEELTKKPEWAENYTVVQTFDARELIEEGTHPASEIMKELDALDKGQIFELLTPFVPAPLIDLAKKKGFSHWTEQKEQNVVKTCFFK